MKIHLLNPILQHKPIFDRNDVKAVTRVLESGWISEGVETKKFQENFRKFLGTKYAIATTSGTVAIFLSLLGAGIKPNDEVIIPNVTFVATASAVKLAGAKPILAEIDKNNFTISIDSIRKKITKKTAGVIPVHLNGRTTNLNELLELAENHNIRIIEDASQGLGSKYGRKFLGSIGDVAAFSLAPTKIITTGQGGVITTNSFKIYDKIRRIKDQGRYDKSDHHTIVGYNFKFTDIHAALGNSQFSKLKSRLRLMKQIHNQYYNLLSKNEHISFPVTRKENQLWYFDILIKKRDLLIKYLEKSKVILRPFLKPINVHTPFKTKEKFLISQKICSLGLYLPAASDLTLKNVEYICKKINLFYKQT